MAKVRLDINSISVQGIITTAQTIANGLTNNPSFPTPSPAPSVLNAKAHEVDAASQEVESLKQLLKIKQSTLDAKRQELRGLVKQARNYVELASSGDETAILSAGMQVRAESTPVGLLLAPQNFSVMEGTNPGMVEMKWKSVKGSNSYIIERSTDPPTSASWSAASVSTKSKFLLGGLNSGERLWFRVAAVNSAGTGAWCSPILKIIP
ncbi:MAG: fibronectin type III domain-containing protein [Ignavibacteria bacterium]|nr:fibronectin type III domain-containing protein [Ignavibacteria bacterium]